MSSTRFICEKIKTRCPFSWSLRSILSSSSSLPLASSINLRACCGLSMVGSVLWNKYGWLQHCVCVCVWICKRHQ